MSVRSSSSFLGIKFLRFFNFKLFMFRLCSSSLLALYFAILFSCCLSRILNFFFLLLLFLLPCELCLGLLLFLWGNLTVSLNLDCMNFSYSWIVAPGFGLFLVLPFISKLVSWLTLFRLDIFLSLLLSPLNNSFEFFLELLLFLVLSWIFETEFTLLELFLWKFLTLSAWIFLVL